MNVDAPAGIAASTSASTAKLKKCFMKTSVSRRGRPTMGSRSQIYGWALNKGLWNGKAGSARGKTSFRRMATCLMRKGL